MSVDRECAPEFGRMLSRRVAVLARHFCSRVSRHAKGGKDRAKVCLVVGAGSGIGAHVARKFAREGYRTVVIRRSDSEKLASPRVVADLLKCGAEMVTHSPGTTPSPLCRRG